MPELPDDAHMYVYVYAWTCIAIMHYLHCWLLSSPTRRPLSTLPAGKDTVAFSLSFYLFEHIYTPFGVCSSVSWYKCPATYTTPSCLHWVSNQNRWSSLYLWKVGKLTHSLPSPGCNKCSKHSYLTNTCMVSFILMISTLWQKEHNGDQRINERPWINLFQCWSNTTAHSTNLIRNSTGWGDLKLFFFMCGHTTVPHFVVYPYPSLKVGWQLISRIALWLQCQHCIVAWKLFMLGSNE